MLSTLHREASRQPSGFRLCPLSREIPRKRTYEALRPCSFDQGGIPTPGVNHNQTPIRWASARAVYPFRRSDG